MLQYHFDPLRLQAVQVQSMFHCVRSLLVRMRLVAMPGAPSSFLLLLVRHLLLEAMHLFLVASLLLVVRPGAPTSVLAPTSDALSLIATAKKSSVASCTGGIAQDSYWRCAGCSRTITRLFQCTGLRMIH